MIHIFWIETSPTQSILYNFRLWQQRYPGKVKIWVDENIKLISEIDSIQPHWPPAMKVDLLRVDVVRKYGGWYCDADSIPGSASLPSLGERILLVREESRRFCNGFFYSPSKHPFLAWWKQEILDSAFQHNNDLKKVSLITGPHALSRAIYLYTLKYGVQRTRTEISTSPWKLIKFENSTRIIRSRNFAALHIALGSWVDYQEPITSMSGTCKRAFFRLRQTKNAVVLDLIRNLIKYPKLFPMKLWQLRLLLNMDNEILSQINSWSEVWANATNDSELVDAVRNLQIGMIITFNEDLAIRLLEGGWISKSKNEWIRPNVTKLVGRH